MRIPITCGKAALLPPCSCCHSLPFGPCIGAQYLHRLGCGFGSSAFLLPAGGANRPQWACDGAALRMKRTVAAITIIGMGACDR